MKTAILSLLLLSVITSKAQVKKNLSQVKTSPDKIISRRDSLEMEDFCEGNGIGNFIIDPKKAQDMIYSFKATYRDVSGGSDLDTSFYLSKEDIFTLDSFLYRPKSLHDGVRIIFGADSSVKDKTTMFVVPTIRVFKPGGTAIDPYSHLRDWGVLKLPTSKYTPALIDAIQLTEHYRDSHIERHGSGHLNQDALSSEAWIDKCVIHFIVGLLKSDSLANGVNVNMAAYSKLPIDPTIGQFKLHQSTIILVITTSDSHENNWEITSQLYQKYYLSGKTAVKPPSAFNHSQLCPQICN